MVRRRIFLFFLTVIIIAIAAYFVIRYSQGYQLNISRRGFEPTGLLVATSIPDGASIWIDGKLKSATNTTLNFPPGTYEIELKKDGFSPWKKRLVIEKELVTKTDAWLFTTTPSLKAMTFTGAVNPLVSPDGQQVIYSVIDSSSTNDGLWILELNDFPLGFSREPRQVLAQPPKSWNLAKISYRWSPDGKQIMLTTGNQHFLLDNSKLNLGGKLSEVSSASADILLQWERESSLRRKSQEIKLPEKLKPILKEKAANIQFSPDETKILYTATASADLPDSIVPHLPASSTQKEERHLQPNHVYVFDLREDKNFYITTSQNARWFPTSKHILIVYNKKISISDYDGTNQVEVYAGNFDNDFVLPFPSGDRLLILTAVGKDTPSNFYAVSLR